jgi:hypothetical protein
MSVPDPSAITLRCAVCGREVPLHAVDDVPASPEDLRCARCAAELADLADQEDEAAQ